MKRGKSLLVIVIVIFMMSIVSGCDSNKDVDSVIGLIDEIGKVTIDSGTDIEAAENGFGELSEKKQSAITNYDKLIKARYKFDAISLFASIGEQYHDDSFCILSSDKLSIEVDTNPMNLDDFTDFETLNTIQGINDKLELPDSLYTKMVSTRALDGRQSQSFDDILVSWSYHPNNGLSVLYELTL